MAMASLDSDGEIVGINVTPLVDIMLVLLIIFMIATRLDVPSAIEAQLPRAATANEVENTQLSIVIRRDGSLHLNGKTATLDDIQRAAASAPPDTQAAISGDKGVSYERVVAAMDALRKGGVYKLALPTDAEDAR